MGEPNLGQLSVLVVDDNHHMVNIVKTILRGFGVKEFFDARCVESGLEVLGKTPIDVVITDYAMTPIDGFEFVRRIRSLDRDDKRLLPVILLTAYAERSKVEAARDAGVNEFCSKPVTAVELYRKVCAVINRPRPFVRTKSYFGPDRRRHAPRDFRGDERRQAVDPEATPNASTPRSYVA